MACVTDLMPMAFPDSPEAMRLRHQRYDEPPPMTFDEGPSDEDLEKLSDDTGYCPECGAEIWDEAPICPKCRAVLSGHTLRRPPMQDWFQRRWLAVMCLLLLLAFLALMLRLF